jgi:phosphoribosyl-AMP cyclohydrolase
MTPEESPVLSLDFDKLSRVAACGGCVPVAVQHADTGEFLLLAYTNERAMREAFRKRRLILWSTSRNELWEKGATSGARFELVEARVNCEQNSLLYRVRPLADAAEPGICHTRDDAGHLRASCYYRRIDLDSLALAPVAS